MWGISSTNKADAYRVILNAISWTRKGSGDGELETNAHAGRRRD